MPASRAASALPPTATVRRPKVVRLRISQPMIVTTAKTRTSGGMPRMYESRSPSFRIPSMVTICVLPSVI
jgi:hypothetical protein